MENIIRLPHFNSRLRPLPSGGRAIRQQPDLEIGMLVFRCPVTHWNIESGVETDRRTFLRIRRLSVPVRCSACQGLHEFKVAAGTLAPWGVRLSRDGDIRGGFAVPNHGHP